MQNEALFILPARVEARWINPENINGTKSYNNDVKIVPSFLCEPVFGDINNYKKLLIDSGYYTEAQLK